MLTTQRTEDRPSLNRNTIKFTLNGELKEVTVDAKQNLLVLLREMLHLTSPKKSCEKGECGACTVLLDDKPVNACLVLAVTVDGKEVTTVEGLGNPAKLHPLQKAFYELGASQCGFCTPGMIVSAKALLDDNANPTVEEVKRALSGNLCRCTGYIKPIEAVLAAAEAMRQEKEVKLGWNSLR